MSMIVPGNNLCLRTPNGIDYIYIDNEPFAVDEKGKIDYASTTVLRNILKQMDYD